MKYFLVILEQQREIAGYFEIFDPLVTDTSYISFLLMRVKFKSNINQNIFDVPHKRKAGIFLTLDDAFFGSYTLPHKIFA